MRAALLLLNLVGGTMSPSGFVRFAASGKGLDAPTVMAVPVRLKGLWRDR